MIVIEKEIKKLLIEEELSVKDLANKINTSQQNLDAKLKRKNLRIKEIEEISEVLGYEFKISFIKK